MDTQQNSEIIAEKELELAKLQANVAERELELLKYKAVPKETQIDPTIPNIGGGPLSNPPTIDWKAPIASQTIAPEQTGQLFSPGQPLPQVAPPFQAGRAYDYSIVTNAQTLPRADEAIRFADLKQLADNCELIRLAIETRKGQFAKLQWNIVLKDPQAKKAEDESDPRIKDIEQLLRYPDGEHPFATWAAMLLDQMLIYDAPSIYPRLNRDGSLASLMLVDGSTIKRVIDLWGRTPEPTDDEPNPPAYQQVIRGVPFVNFTKQELIYWPFNPRVDHLYGLSPVEQVLVTANMFMRRQSLQLNYFTEGTLPDFFFTLPKEWTPDQIDLFATNFYAMMAGNDASRRHGRFLPDGAKVEQTKAELLKDDFDEWLARVVCFAFSLPPSAFVRQMNRATASQAQEAAIQEGLAPIMIWFKGLMDYILEVYFKQDDLMFKWVEDESIDPLEAAQASKIYLDAGTLTPNEVRQGLGYDPLPDMDDAFVVAGSSIVLVKDIMAGATKPPDPIAVAHANAQAGLQGQQQSQKPTPGKPPAKAPAKP